MIGKLILQLTYVTFSGCRHLFKKDIRALLKDQKLLKIGRVFHIWVASAWMHIVSKTGHNLF